MDGFNKVKAELDAFGARVIAASVDAEDKAAEVGAGLGFPVAYGVTSAVAERIGGWWEPKRGIVQPSELIVQPDGKVLSSTYSSGPIGRVDAADVVTLIKFIEARKAKG
ncbi:MAG: peroxiredoxin family protein [Alphaproteobacteria bacterium]|nr:peroxiredoxin family protein [Alphaproteobacteria bacterium]